MVEVSISSSMSMCKGLIIREDNNNKPKDNTNNSNKKSK